MNSSIFNIKATFSKPLGHQLQFSAMTGRNPGQIFNQQCERIVSETTSESLCSCSIGLDEALGGCCLVLFCCRGLMELLSPVYSHSVSRRLLNPTDVRAARSIDRRALPVFPTVFFRQFRVQSVIIIAQKLLLCFVQV